MKRNPRGWVPLLALAVALTLVGAASAHTIGTSARSVQDGSPNWLCVYNSAWIQHGPAIDSAADVKSVRNWPSPVGCNGNADKDPYNIALNRVLWVWTGSAWSICNDSGWVYNTTRTWQVYHQRQFGSYICGAYRYYGTMGSGYVWASVGGWRGTGVWSNYHLLPG